MCVDSPPDTSCLHFFELLQADESDMPEVDISPNDVIALPYSSRTRSLSQGVMLTHKGLVTSVVLFVLPIFHIYSLNSVLLCGLRAGAAPLGRSLKTPRA
ncbi:hypothetical protein C1H46_034206 [Malus baccata]|uniref:4-coumarate--CoA ligase n=1 Tax=Malus baccata TaxID=106549 RepID=A0A540L1A5_MALBA|nr:hypothetical protein C1H46_034206 [Malus baccata]